MPRFARPRSENFELLARDEVGIEGNRSRVTIVTQDKIFSAVAAHFQAFRHGGRNSGALQHHVRPVTGSDSAHGLDAGGRFAHFVEVNRVIGAKSPGQFQPMFRSSNHRHPGGPGISRDRQRRNTDRSGALNDHLVTPQRRQNRHPARLRIRRDTGFSLGADSFHTMNRRDEGATGSDHRLRRKVARDSEDICARPQIMKLRVSSKKMRRLIAAIPDAVGAAVRTTGRLPFPRAVVAFPARGRRSPRDAVADFQRLTGPILFESFAELFQAPDGFVSEDDRQGNRELSFPEVNVRAADARHLCPRQRRARFESGR